MRSNGAHPQKTLPKLLFVIDNLSTGGSQRQMANLAIGFKRRGYPVDFFCYAQGDLLASSVREAGIAIYTQTKSSRYSPDVIFQLHRLIQAGNYELVLAFQYTPNFYAITASRLVGAPHVPVVVSERSFDPPRGLPATERFVRLFYRFATHITVNSYHQGENFTQKYPYMRGRLSTIYNGYDLNVFTPATHEPDNHPIRIASIASISYVKNGMCLVEALRILREQYGMKPCVDWIGEQVMSGERLQCFQEMDAKIRAYGLEHQWQWLGQRTDIVDQLHQHDVLIHPSYGEGLPNVVCEAICCARPVIVSNTLDHTRLVQDGENGYLFDWRDADDLARRIKQFSDLPVAERRKMGQCSRMFAEEHLSLDRLVDDYERLFASLLNGGRK